MTLLRSLRTSLFFAPLFAVAASCSSHPAPGALMLAMTTDLDVPEDVTSVGLRIATPSRVLIDHTSSVQHRNDGSAFVRLPATFAVLSPESSDDSPSVTATAVAYNKLGAAIVLRRAVSTVPHGRIALLRMPLLWSNLRTIKVDAAKAAAQSTGNLKLRFEDSSEILESPCPAGQTVIGDECASDFVAPAELVNCATNDCMDRFFPAGGATASQCFDVSQCFIDGVDSEGKPASLHRVLVPVDSNCVATLPASLMTGTAVNLAVAVGDGVGKCTDKKARTGCFVGLRPSTVFGKAEGYERVGTTASVQLPKFVCKKGLKVYGTIGCNRVFDETIEACPVAGDGDGTSEPTPVAFSAPGVRMSEDAGMDASARVSGPSDGRLLWNTGNAVPLAIRTDYQTTSNLVVAASGGRVYRTTAYDSCAQTDGGAISISMPPPTDGLGKAPIAYALALWPNTRGTAVGVMGSPSDPQPQSTIAHFTGLTGGSGVPVSFAGPFVGRAVDVAYTSGSSVWVSRYDTGGQLELARATTFASDTFTTQAVVNGSGALSGAIYAQASSNELYTARRDSMVGTASIGKISGADGCGTTAACMDNVVVRLTDPVRSIATVRSMFKTPANQLFFTTILPGRTDIDVYWLNANAMPVLLASDMAVGDRGLGTPPVSIGADSDCVYVIRNSPNQADGGAPPTSHELVCIQWNVGTLPAPITVLAHVGNATAMGTYTPGGTLTRIYWGEVTAQSVGEVRCIEHMSN